MQTITKKQYDSLVQVIYISFINNPDYGLGEMNDCKEESERIVNQWMEDNGIQNEDA
jgi:hypothetical protein